MPDLEDTIAHDLNVVEAIDITKFVINYFKGRGTKYTTRAARLLSKRANVRFFYNETPHLQVDYKLGAELSSWILDLVLRHERNIVKLYEQQNDWHSSLEQYQLEYIAERMDRNLAIGTLEDGTVVGRLWLGDYQGWFSLAQLRQLELLQSLAI